MVQVADTGGNYSAGSCILDWSKMIYAIDNCEPFGENREIIFVIAPASFEEWFTNVLQPWQRAVIAKGTPAAWFHVHVLICVARMARFVGSTRPVPVKTYLSDNSLLPELVNHLWNLPFSPYRSGES